MVGRDLLESDEDLDSVPLKRQRLSFQKQRITRRISHLTNQLKSFLQREVRPYAHIGSFVIEASLANTPTYTTPSQLSHEQTPLIPVQNICVTTALTTTNNIHNNIHNNNNNTTNHNNNESEQQGMVISSKKRGKKRKHNEVEENELSQHVISGLKMRELSTEMSDYRVFLCTSTVEKNEPLTALILDSEGSLIASSTLTSDHILSTHNNSLLTHHVISALHFLLERNVITLIATPHRTETTLNHLHNSSMIPFEVRVHLQQAAVMPLSDETILYSSAQIRALRVIIAWAWSLPSLLLLNNITQTQPLNPTALYRAIRRRSHHFPSENCDVITPPNILRVKLRPYQQRAVRWALTREQQCHSSHYSTHDTTNAINFYQTCSNSQMNTLKVESSEVEFSWKELKSLDQKPLFFNIVRT
jgi:hypothetical protein